MNHIEIKIVYDNCKAKDGFQEGWGFSCYIELPHRRLLFDTGADAQALFSNLQKLNIRCDGITDLIFSHKHYDHIAGCEEILTRLKEGSRLFLPKKFPSKKIPPTIQVERVEEFREMDSGIYSFVLRGGFFLYEQALAIQTSKGVVVITGCAHPGIIRILEEVQTRLQQPLHLVLGGFHLFRKSHSHIDNIVKRFTALEVQMVAPCHCTGSYALERFHERYHDRCITIGTGKTLTLEQ